jgi:hypothetical protein
MKHGRLETPVFNLNFRVQMKEILEYLKKHGESHDTRIAEAIGKPLDEIRSTLSKLSATYDVVQCQSTRYVDGMKIVGNSYRLSAITPKAKPGAKAKAQVSWS